MRKSKQQIPQMEQSKARITPGFSGRATEISEFPGKAKTEFQIWHPGNGSRDELLSHHQSSHSRTRTQHTHQIHKRLVAGSNPNHTATNPETTDEASRQHSGIQSYEDKSTEYGFSN